MTRPDEEEGRIRPDSGLESLQIQRQPRLCQQNVDLQHGFVAVLELRLDRGHLRGKSHEDALDLLRFLRAVLQNAGVGFHNGLRLDEDGSTRRRNIVDDAADFAAVLALNRDNIAPISHGNDALLQIFGGIHVTDHALQPVADAVLGDADLFAQLVQGMGSCIRHGVRGQNGTGDLLLQTGLWCQRIKQVVRRQGIVVGGAVPAAQILKVAQCTGHHQQLAHGEHAALDRAGHELADTFHAAKAG